MSTIRNMLTTFGVFWVSLWVARVLQLPSYDRLINAVVRDETVLSALAMGVMSSTGRTVAAVFAGVLVTVAVDSRRSELWALIVAALYLVDAPVRFHWVYPAGWDRMWQGVSLLFPVTVCIVAAVVTARLRNKRG
jgi:hypothetical protein